MKTYKALFLITALTVGLMASGCASLSDTLIWQNEDTGSKQGKKGAVDKSGEIIPAGLEGERVNPIASDDSVKTALSRPKVVKVEESTAVGAGRSHFDVIDERAQGSLAPVIDAGAKPVRTVTYDNNSMQKDYPIRFGVAWNRVIEGLLDTPLDTVDRSSGLIITGWILDERKDTAGMTITPFGGADKKVRYKYTVRALDRGNVTQIKIVPFAETVQGQRWEKARPSLLVTKKMFERIERELAVPLPFE
ncbi:MAG: hypothetical protein HQK86_08100 [Nitrospinae bacterium]|nr:hypothetical protein [Nitrospinota bacterium]MBF0635089.1 hypothetical protein [Nitrospinota bacterium]